MPLKVLYVVPPSTHFAGMERVIHDVASGLATQYRDRISVTVLYCYRYGDLAHDLPYRVIWEDSPQLRKFPFRVARWLRKEPYDIVVGAQFEPTALLWLCHRLLAGKARFVMHLHGNPKVEGAGSRRARLAFTMFDTLLPRMQRVLAVSPSLALYIENRIGRAGLVEYLPNPVRQFSHVTPSPRRDDRVRFLTIGRLARQKGHDILIAAFASAVGAGLDAQLTIVGDGPEHGALAALIDRLRVTDRVRLAGDIADPAKELGEAHCFVSASRWEGFGLVIVEALSAGLFVIASDCEFGPSDLIDSPAKGQIVPTEDVAALSAAMIAFARNGRPDSDTGDRRSAAAAFSLGQVVTQHAAMLEAVGARGS